MYKAIDKVLKLCPTEHPVNHLEISKARHQGLMACDVGDILRLITYHNYT